ncbi:MAG: penicillin-binding protein 2 [Formosimonas sp.]
MSFERRGPTSAQHAFRTRLWVVNFLIFTCFSILIGRFVYLQVVRHDDFDQKAVSNSTSLVPIAPERGKILDRNGDVLASNNLGFSLEISPRTIDKADNEKIDAALARLIPQLQAIVSISEVDISKFNALRQEANNQGSFPIRLRLSEEEIARFSVEQFKFKGVAIEKRMFREYPNKNMGVHVVGYVGRINKTEQERLENNQKKEQYLGTTHIGKLGIEQSYEDILHGTAGYEVLEVTAGGKRMSELGFEEAVNGANVQLTIDAYMQSEVEKAFAGRRGALVAIEPATGEVLAFVSSPTFDPNDFVNGIDSEKWKSLNESTDKPLLNRALRGGYPIGSTYKPFMAIAALHSGTRSADKVIADGGIYTLGGHKFRDSTGGRGHGMVNMFQSIAVSSDVYYYSLAYEMGIDLMYQELSRFGFGQKTGIDLVGELSGILPSKEYYAKVGKTVSGKPLSDGVAVSLGIGQGENTFTIMQLAYATSILANNGVGMKPHLLKAVVDPKTGTQTPTAPAVQADLQIPAKDLEVVRKGMIQVNISGTGRGIFNDLPGQVAGKTGTAQTYTVAQNSTYRQSGSTGAKKDHSLYIAFYPADKPRVAIAAIVENGGFGASAAAPLVHRALQALNESAAGKRFSVVDTKTAAKAVTP